MEPGQFSQYSTIESHDQETEFDKISHQAT